MEQDCTQFAVIILCHDSTGCDEMGDYFATEADTMINIVRLTKIKVVFEYMYLYLTGIFIKSSHLNVNYYFLFVCLYILVL